jgi:hypothetical protein
MRQTASKTLVFSSSGAVYGESHRGLISETEFPRPVNPYGRTKVIIEEILAACALRVFGHALEYDPCGTGIPLAKECAGARSTSSPQHYLAPLRSPAAPSPPPRTSHLSVRFRKTHRARADWNGHDALLLPSSPTEVCGP